MGKLNPPAAALLVKKEDLDNYLAGMIKDEEEIVKDLRILIPHTGSTVIKKSLQTRLSQGEQALLALKAGYVPLEGGYWTKTDSKSKWSKPWLKKILAEMPRDVKEVWDKVKEKGIFDSFSVTGDPVLAGNLGRHHYFIATWIPMPKGASLGFKIKIP